MRDLTGNLQTPFYTDHVHMLTHSLLSECCKHSPINWIFICSIPVNSTSNVHKSYLVVLTLTSLLSCNFL